MCSPTIIAGTPGVGRSLVLFYLLCKLVQAGERVVFRSLHLDVYLRNGRVRRAKKHCPPREEMEHRSSRLFYLCDEQCMQREDLNRVRYQDHTFVFATPPKLSLTFDLLNTCENVF